MIPTVLLLTVILASIWVYSDSKRTNPSSFLPIFWLISVLVMPIIMIPLYLVLYVARNRFLGRYMPKNLGSKFCPKCGADNALATTVCTSCHNKFSL